MKLKTFAFLIPLSLVVSGCATTNSGKGAGIGALAGAVLAKATGDHDDSRMIWGAAVGAIAGAAIGDYMDEQEQQFKESLAGTGVDVVREGDQLRLIMPDNITFAVNQAKISPQFYSTLDSITQVLTEYNKTTLSIDGHTDSTGSAEYNQQLSEHRAMSVRRFFIDSGIHSDRLYVYGYGESRPVVANDTPEHRAMNRRVEIQITPNRA